MNASTPAAPGAPAIDPTIDPREAAHFGRMAADWWDPKGASAMLHRLNPARLRHLRARLDLHWGSAAAALRPLAGKRALDIGCGGGLVAEPLARLGAEVTAIDAAPETIAIARAHAEGQGLAIDYRVGGIESLGAARFDLVTCFEVIEHSADPAAFVAGLARLLDADGLLLLSTPNRTALSRLAVVTLGERLGGIPEGTHDWERFLTPAELGRLIETAGLRIDDVTGLGFDPRRGFTTGRSTAIDYLLTASRDT